MWPLATTYPRLVHRFRAVVISFMLVACTTERPAADSVAPERRPSESATVKPALTPASSEVVATEPSGLRLELVASGLDLPSGIAVGGDGTLYVNETRSGLVRVISADGTLTPEPFLDLSDRIRGDGE